MIVATSERERLDVRLFEGASRIPPHGSPELLGVTGHAALALRVTAITTAVGLVSETTASFDVRTYAGPRAEAEPIDDSWQSQLFDHPAEDWTRFDFLSDLTSSIELDSAGFVWKVLDPSPRSKQRVTEMYPLPADAFTVRRQGDGKRQIIARVDGEDVDVSRNVIYIRNWAARPGPFASSRIALGRASIESATAYEEFRGSYFKNDGSPGLIITAPGRLTAKQRHDVVETWEQRHAGGAEKKHRVGLLWAGMTADTLGTSLRDSQAAELAFPIVLEAARMFRIYPAGLLHATVFGANADPRSAELWADLFMRFSLTHRLERIAEGFRCDRDLFPQRRLWPRFDPESFLRGDLATLAAFVHKLVQSGVISRNEGRAKLGMARVDDPEADKLLTTPVGAGGGLMGEAGDDDVEPDDEGDDERVLEPAWELRENGKLARTR